MINKTSESNIIIDAISLLIREQKIVVKNPSDDLIEKVFKTIETNGSKDTLNGLSLTSSLLSYGKDLLERKKDGDKLIISNITRYIVIEMKKHEDEVDDLELRTIIKDSLTPETKEDEIKDTIRSLRNRLYTYYVNQELKGVARYINTKLNKGTSESLLSKVRSKLEELEEASNVKDDAILNEIIFNKQELEENAERIFEAIKEKKVYKTGYMGFNEAAQGGLRTGETTIVGALSHHNKTGFTIGLTAGLLLMNKFKRKNKKVPLVLHLSYEDPETTVLIKYYDQLKITFEGKIDENRPSLKEMAEYIESVFSKSGATFMLTHVDPTKWGFRDMFNYLNNIEAQGYYFVAIDNDYLDKLGSGGLDKSGPIGAEKRELLRRVRNDMIKRDCSYISPWQFNSKANDLLTQGLSPIEFPKFVTGKSMFQGNGTLDTDIDLEVSIAKYVDNNGKTYQVTQVGKHRLPTVAPESKKYFIYQFPPEGPIPLDAVIGKKAFKRKIEDFNNDSTEVSLF